MNKNIFIIQTFSHCRGTIISTGICGNIGDNFTGSNGSPDTDGIISRSSIGLLSLASAVVPCIRFRRYPLHFVRRCGVAAATGGTCYYNRLLLL